MQAKVRMIKDISREEILLKTAQGERLIVVEVSDLDDYQLIHIAKAIHLPPQGLAGSGRFYLGEPAADIIVYGVRPEDPLAYQVAEQLEMMGYPNLYFYRGGKRDWMQAGLPVESGKRFMKMAA